jgi:hypothetical protein
VTGKLRRDRISVGVTQAPQPTQRLPRGLSRRGSHCNPAIRASKIKGEI